MEVFKTLIVILLSSVLLFSPDAGTFSGDSVHEKRERIRDRVKSISIVFFMCVLLSWVDENYVEMFALYGSPCRGAGAEGD